MSNSNQKWANFITPALPRVMIEMNKFKLPQTGATLACQTKISPRGPVLAAKSSLGDHFCAVSAERCPYGKDGVPHPSICMYLRTLRNLSFQKFSSPDDVLQYSYLTCQVSCTIGLPTDIFLGKWRDAIVQLLHTCCNVSTSYEERTTLVYVIK